MLKDERIDTYLLHLGFLTVSLVLVKKPPSPHTHSVEGLGEDI